MPPPATGMTGCSVGSIRSRRMSSGRPTTTGPGRPLRAANMASATISDARSAWSRTITRLAPVSNQALMSNSWNASRSRCANGIRPTNSSIGVESCQAVCSPTCALAAPGPRVTIATPGRWFNFPSASAMYAAPPSWRHTMVSMSELCRPSNTSRKLSPGTTYVRSTPWAASESTITCPADFRAGRGAVGTLAGPAWRNFCSWARPGSGRMSVAVRAD
jgi:hypothetical protein